MKNVVLVLALLISSLATAQTVCSVAAGAITCVSAPPPPPPVTTILTNYGMAIQTALHTIWVAPMGNDVTCAVDSTSLTCGTMSKAAALAVPGDVVRVLAGTYPIVRSSVSKSGTAAGRIQFVSDIPGGAKFVASASTWAALVFTGSYIDAIGFDVTCTATCDSGIQLNGSHVSARANNVHDIQPAQPATGHVGGGGIHCFDSGTNVDCNIYDNSITNFGNLLPGCGSCVLPVEDARWFYHAIYQETNGDVVNNRTVNTSGHGIQTYHAGASGNVIEHNMVINPWRSGILVSNSVTNGNAGSMVRYNTIAFANLWCVDVSNATGAIIDHNTGSHCGSGTMRDTGTATTSTNWTLK